VTIEHEELIPELESVERTWAPMHQPVEVVVRGKKFLDGVTAIYFGEQACQTEYVSETELRTTFVSDWQGIWQVTARKGWWNSSQALEFRTGGPWRDWRRR
jgi:hypothetical protein